MTKVQKEILEARLKSFLWRLGVTVAIALVAWLGENLELFDLPVWVVGMVALILGEVTKFLNSNLAKFQN